MHWKEMVQEASLLFHLENTVGCKWIFSIKQKADGSIERFKAHLVAKGNTQAYGINYQETFASVAKLYMVHVLLSIVANHDWTSTRCEECILEWRFRGRSLHGNSSQF